MPLQKFENVGAGTRSWRLLRRARLTAGSPEESFDRFTSLATRVLNVPAALLCFFEKDRQFLKSQCGLRRSSGLPAAPKSFQLDSGRQQGSIIVRDTQEDSLSQTCPAIPGRLIKAFMRIPLASANGSHLGNFYVVDFKPRDWSESEVEILRDIASAVESEVQLRLELARRGEAEESYRELSLQLERQARSRTKEVVRALRKARVLEERFKSLIERVPQAVAMFDKDMRYLLYSRQWAKDYRLEGELLGRCHYDIFPEIPERWKAHHRRVLNGESLASEEDSFVRADGKREWLRWELVPWFESDGSVGGLIVLTEVLTERRKEQAEIRGKYRELELITTRLLKTQKAAKLAHWSWNSASNTICLSPHCGRAEVEVPWESIREDISPEDLPQLESMLQQSLDSSTDDFKMEFSLKDGRILLARGRSDGACISGIVQDVSVVRGLEGQLRHSQKLESIGALVGGVAHDLNNILCSILLPAEMAASMVEQDHPVQEDLEAILDSGKRAKALVSQLLRFSRRKKATIKTFNLNESLTEVSKMLVRLLPSRVTLAMDLCEEPCLVRMDPSAFEQVVTNLVVNARDAMPDVGEIRIRTSRSDRSDGTVCLKVSDTGEGISEDILDKIFEPFFTTKEVGRGTGLGLSVCQGIVREADGELAVETSHGEGTCFRVTLPLATIHLHPRSSRSSRLDKLPKGRERVLLVEDDRRIRRTLVRLLTSLGYTVDSYSGGEEALSRCYGPDKEAPDILLLDVSLPRIDGRELASEIRMSLPHLPVLLISGAEVLQSGTWLVGERNYFLAKPFTKHALATKLREALSSLNV